MDLVQPAEWAAVEGVQEAVGGHLEDLPSALQSAEEEFVPLLSAAGFHTADDLGATRDEVHVEGVGASGEGVRELLRHVRHAVQSYDPALSAVPVLVRHAENA